jgi:lipopolysaccharide biosynthesis glycosyltransferase
MSTNKNLIYYQVNEAYLNCFLYNVKLCRKYNDTDICCIIPKTLQEKIPADIFFFCPEEFDHRSTAKYQIVNWERFHEYDNILYLDCDAFVKKTLTPIFDIIQNEPNYIHGVKELHNLKDGDHYFRITKNIYEEGHNHAYNAGTFGFNKQLTPYFIELIDYIKQPEYQNIYVRFSEQPYFNEFFSGIKNIIKPTLSNFVYLGGRNSSFNSTSPRSCTNSMSFDDATVIHYLGGWGGGGDGKLLQAQHEINE